MHHMNPQRGRHMGAKDESQSGDHQGKPDIHIKSHEQGHTLHVMHQDGRHEKFEHEDGDTHGMAEHLHEQLGNDGSDREQGEQRPENDLGVEDDMGLTT